MKRKSTSPFVKFENKWVATDPEGKKVLESARTIAELEKKLSKIKVGADVVLKKILPFDKAYVPFSVTR